jgi:nickel transport protein
VTTEIRVDEKLDLAGFDKPLVAAYTKYVTGIGVILGLFGIYALWTSRRKGIEDRRET